jgi:hypothetical protein
MFLRQGFRWGRCSMRDRCSSALLAAVLSVVIAVPAFAETVPVSTNPYSRGTFKKVAGTVLIPASVGVGLVLFVAGSLSYCDDHDLETRRAQCDREARQGSNMMAGGGAVIAGGVSAGILLLVFGVRDGRRWKQWESEHNGGQLIPAKNDTMFVPNVTPWIAKGKAGLSLSWAI